MVGVHIFLMDNGFLILQHCSDHREHDQKRLLDLDWLLGLKRLRSECAAPCLSLDRIHLAAGGFPWQMDVPLPSEQSLL